MNDLSVIIVSYKGWNRLIKCLDSLSIFGGIRFSMEVIVVDNSSGKEFRELEGKYPGFKFISNEVNGGFANGCNLGAKHATGRFLLFLNPDTVILEEEAGKLLEAAEKNPDFGILSCTQFNEKGRESRAWGAFPRAGNLTGFQRSVAKLFTGEIAGDSDKVLFFPDWVSGSVLLIRKKVYNDVTGFDEDFWMYYEDVDLCRRVRNKGGNIAFFRNISVEHNHGGSSRINSRTYAITKTEVFISKHVYISKHTKGIYRVLLQTFLVINNILTGLLAAVPGVIFFFMPGLRKRFAMFARLAMYYAKALLRSTWMSPQSVNYLK